MAEILKDCSVPWKMSWDELEALCRREGLHCEQLGVNRTNPNEYDVEFLCDYKKTKEEELYLVKWRGFPESDNTWEPKRNLKCPKLMKQFHRDLEQELRRHKRRCTPKRLDKEVASYLVQKAKLRQSLQRWEAHLNQTRNHPGRIFVLNEVDFEGPPKHFTYINNYKVGQGIVLDEMAVGCECKNCLEEPISGCCPGASLHRMAYNDRGQVRIRPGQPIYECNSRCSCSLDCPNRVVQKGIQFDLCIFKTENGRGWGVRTLQHIKKNTFIMEYVGECNPNLQVYNVFIDNIDERLPRIALFSTRAIRAGEELTFDYKMQIDPVDTESTKMDSSFSLAGLPSSPKKRIRVECRCGSDSCRKYLF
ncbi:histone-lysine N-methyltransferase SUV39H1-like isoform X3 [Sander vitreus]